MFVGVGRDDSVTLELVRSDQSGENAVDVDIVFGPHKGKVVGQAHNAGFRRGIMQLVRIAFTACSGRNVNDLAVLLFDHLFASGHAR